MAHHKESWLSRVLELVILAITVGCTTWITYLFGGLATALART